jgi:hypothetical protein
LAVSSATVGSFILRLAIDLSLHWNPQFYLDPIPFHLGFASSFFIGIQGEGFSFPFFFLYYIKILSFILIKYTQNYPFEDCSTVFG